MPYYELNVMGGALPERHMEVDGTAKYLLALSLIPLSCGAIHQMIPPTPLEHHENRVDFIATFDLNNVEPFPNFDIASYWGIGKDYSFGFSLFQVSIAKYFDKGDKLGKHLFASINNIPLPLHLHPNVELGAGLGERLGQESQSFSGGIWLVFNENFVSPLWFFPLRMNSNQNTLHATRPVVAGPFIKYSYHKRDVGFSLHNYLGMTRMNLTILRKRYFARNPIITFKNADVDSIYYDDSGLLRKYRISINKGEQHYELYTLPYQAWSWHRDLMLINKYRYDMDTRAYHIRLDEDSREAVYEINMRQVIVDYESGKDLILIYNAAYTENIIKRIKWYKDDWSVGVSKRLPFDSP